MKFFKGDKGRKYLEYLFLIVISILFYKLIDIIPWSIDGVKAIFSIAAPVISAFIITFLLHVPALKIENLLKKTKGFFSKHARGISVLAVYLILIVFIALFIYAIIPVLTRNVVELAKNVPGYTERVIAMLRGFADENGLIFGFDVFGALDKLPKYIVDFFSTERIFSVLSGAYSVGSTIVSVILTLIISVYMMLDRDSLVSTCGKVMGIFVRGKTVSATHDYLKRISAIFYSYVYSQLLDALIVSVIFTIVFAIIGVPYFFFFGVLIGVMNLIPYFGAIIGGVIVVFVTLITNGLTSALITAILILVVQQLDANILQPRIVGETVGIRPLYVLAAITVGGGLFGFWGVLISVPTMATIRMILIDLVNYTDKKRAAERKAAAKKIANKSE
ncbi:MAG: AI-2E family transporter [Clostridia bacterium]|nr:AI-2E family transporter [Clostridia bacterium]